MHLPGFTADRAVYTSNRSYASLGPSGRVPREHVSLARMSDPRGDTGTGGGYDPDKGRRADPFGGYGAPLPDTGGSFWDTLGRMIAGARSGVLVPYALACQLAGGTPVLHDDGTYECRKS